MVRNFTEIVEAMSDETGVERGRMFGAEGLNTAGKVFAMEVKGELVVKLSLPRADELVGSGKARRFDPGHGRPMKQWVSVPAASGLDWFALAREAKTYVAGA